MKKCAKAKEELINRQCEELEDLAIKNQQLLCKKIKTMSIPKMKTASTALKNKNGDVIVEKQMGRIHWEGI